MGTFTIVGATGNTGSVAAERLLAAGHRVRAIGRSAERLESLRAKGGEPVVAEVHDAEALRRAFAGSDGVYLMVPPDLASPDPIGHYRRIGDAFVAALAGSGVRRAVLLSSLGAEHASGTGPIVGLHHVEEALAATGIDQLRLRAGYFMENFFGSLPVIRSAGVNGGAIEPATPMTMVATHDLGVAIADELASGAFRGVDLRELAAEAEPTMTEATTMIGAAIGRPDLAYVRFPDAGFVDGLMGAGFSRAVAESFVEMAKAIGTGRVARTQPKTARTIAPTSFEAFVPALATAYSAG